jgi:hypothetical protein
VSLLSAVFRLYACFVLSFFNLAFIFYLLTFPRISQAIAVLPVSWGFCENCLSVFCEFFHSMIPATQQWEPRAFYGAPSVATAFFGYFFWLQKKSASPAVRIPQSQTKIQR